MTNKKPPQNGNIYRNKIKTIWLYIGSSPESDLWEFIDPVFVGWKYSETLKRLKKDSE